VCVVAERDRERGGGAASPSGAAADAGPASGSGTVRDSGTAPARLRVAYLVNQYPKVSHSFIRREIAALEAQGVAVERIALRGWDGELVDAADLAERARTRYVLRDGLGPLAGAALAALATRPRRFLAALGAALAMGRRSVRPLPYHLVWLAEACRIRAWLAASGATHLHAHFGTNPAEIALLVRLLGGPPYSFTVHGADEADNAARLALGRKVAGARFVAAISDYTRSQLLRWCAPEHWAKVRVVHCGLSEEFLAAPAAPLPEAPHFLCIGRLSGEKGHLILLEAFAALAARLPAARLVLAGDGELRGAIEARIAALGLGARVRITGWIDSATVQAELAAARALVQPSFQEGLPVVIMEAMALRRPVISTYVAGIPELVLPGETGWLVPAGNAGALAEAMAAAAAAPAARLAAMGEAAAARVAARHSAAREAGKLAALFAAGPDAGPDPGSGAAP
jgi:colanic acid/amylovoran biosynthesis glycosyltransferase